MLHFGHLTSVGRYVVVVGRSVGGQHCHLSFPAFWCRRCGVAAVGIGLSASRLVDCLLG